MSFLYRLADAAAEMAALGASVQHIGCFRLCLDAASELAELNYAIPWASPWSYEQVRLALARMRDVFGDQRRTPRVTFLREAWPWLGPVLEDAAFVEESAIDLMICTAATFRPAARLPVRLIDPADPAAFVAVEAVVFPEEASEPGLVSYQIANGFWRCAVAFSGNEAVAAGTLVPQGRVAELAAMATLPQHRRCGYGSAIATFLVQSHFEAGGDLVWLGAANSGAVAVYESLGFRPAGSRVTFAAR